MFYVLFIFSCIEIAFTFHRKEKAFTAFTSCMCVKTCLNTFEQDHITHLRK